MDALESNITLPAEVLNNTAAQQPTSAPGTEVPQPPKPKTEEVDVSNLSQENKDTIQVDWGSSEKGKENSFFDGPTKQVPSSQPANSPASTQTAIPSANFEIGVKVIIAIIDFIMSNVLWKIAGEGKAASYSADAESRKNLQDSIVMILGENRVKMPTWLIVLFAFLAAYGFQIMGAIEARKNKSKNKSGSTQEKSSLDPGLFTKDGVVYRRYANGSVREAKFDSNNNEIIVGQPTKMKRRMAA